MLDFHMHSTASDGTLSPADLVERMRSRGVELMSLTDHDTVAGLAEAAVAAASASIELVPGIEISSTVGGKSVHVLGYYFEPSSPAIAGCLSKLIEGRGERNREMAERLTALGMPLDLSEVEALAGGTVGRPHFAQLMQDKGYVASYEEAFERWLGDGRPGHVKREVLSPDAAACAIHAAGGVSVLAHPLVYGRDPSQIERSCKHAREWGMDGIEVYYSTHSKGETDTLRYFAERSGLLMSGGSDFHRDPWPNAPEISVDVAAPMRARAETRKAA